MRGREYSKRRARERRAGGAETAVCAYAQRPTITHTRATRHAPPRWKQRKHSLWDPGAAPCRRGAGGWRQPPAAGHGGAEPPKALRRRAGRGDAEPRTPSWGRGTRRPPRTLSNPMRSSIALQRHRTPRTRSRRPGRCVPSYSGNRYILAVGTGMPMRWRIIDGRASIYNIASSAKTDISLPISASWAAIDGTLSHVCGIVGHAAYYF